MNKLLIGLSAKMAMGKTTLANMLAQFGNAEIVSVARPLYELQDMIYEKCGIQLQGEKDRDLLIALGQWGRGIDNNFWLEQLAKKVLESKAEIIICDDIRFPQEAEFFDKHGLLFRINGIQRGANVDTSKSTAESEIALDDYPFRNVLDNLKTPEQLCQDIAHKVVSYGKMQK